MTARNDITGDLIKTKGTNSSEFDKNFDAIFPQKPDTIEDGHGNSWQKCGKRCWLEVIGVGKVQCNKPNCGGNYVA